MTARIPGKRQTLLAFLERGVAMVHLDARRAGVLVPRQHTGDAHLRLNLSYRYGIPDLEVTEQRVRATLSFGGAPFQCVIPWEAVFAVTSSASGDGQVWPEDLPVEVVQQAQAEQAAAARRPALAAVSAAPEESVSPKEPGVAARGHLRLVR